MATVGNPSGIAAMPSETEERSSPISASPRSAPMPNTAPQAASEAQTNCRPTRSSSTCMVVGGGVASPSSA